MITKIASGYFIWEPIIWTAIFCLSMLLVSCAVFFASRKTGIKYVSDVSQGDDSTEILKAADYMQVLREKSIEPWLKSQYRHLLVPLVFFIVILTIVFLH